MNLSLTELLFPLPASESLRYRTTTTPPITAVATAMAAQIKRNLEVRKKPPPARSSLPLSPCLDAFPDRLTLDACFVIRRCSR